MIDRLTKKWAAYSCSEKGEAATDKEDVRFLVNALADELDRLGWSRNRESVTKWIREAVNNCGRKVTYADTHTHEGLKVIFPKGPCKLEKGHKGQCSFYGVKVR